MAPPHVGAHGAVAWMAVVTALLASLHGLGPMHLALTVRMGFGRFVPCMKTEDEVMHPHVLDTCGLSSVVIPRVILRSARPTPSSPHWVGPGYFLFPGKGKGVLAVALGPVFVLSLPCLGSGVSCASFGDPWTVNHTPSGVPPTFAAAGTASWAPARPPRAACLRASSRRSWSTALTAASGFTFRGIDMSASFGLAVGSNTTHVSSIYQFNGSLSGTSGTGTGSAVTPTVWHNQSSVSLPRYKFWDIQVPRIHSPTRQVCLRRPWPSWSP